MIKLENVGKIYSTNNNLSVGIRKVNLELNLGEFVAITGESGSGKSTLLNIISGIDSYDEGEMYVSGEETSYFTINDLENYRNKYVGYIFQNYNIIDSYTVLENVEASLLFNNLNKKERREKALELIERVGLKNRVKTKASKLSGGEKQRVVIARALAKDPLIIAADEPTGNLDSKTSKEIIDLLHEVSENKLVIVVTHDFNEVKEYATRYIRIFDNEVKEDKVLVPKEKIEAPNLFDEPKRKLSFRNLFHISFIDLFSSVKRSLFFLLMFLILSVSLITGVSIFRHEMEFNNTFSTSLFSNTDSLRVVLNKWNNEPFSKDEINEITQNNLIKEYYINDLSLDDFIYIDYSVNDCIVYSSTSLYLKKAASISESDLSYGTLPVEYNDIVITVTENDYINEIEKEELIGKTVTIYDVDCTIKGIIERSIDSSGISNYIYVTDDFYNDNEFQLLINDSTIYFGSQNNSHDNLLITVNSELSGHNMIYHPLSFDIGFDIFSPFVTTTTQIFNSFTISTLYDTYEITETEQENYFRLAIVGQSDYTKYYDTLEVSNEFYNELYALLNSKTYQISLFTNSSIDTDLLRTELRNQGYNAVSPYYDYSVDEFTESFESLTKGIYFTFFAFTIIGITILVYIILLRLIRSRKNDYIILRTIGASKRNIYEMLTIQLLLSAIISYLLALIIFIVLRFTSSDIFETYSKLVTNLDLLFILIINLLISLILSYLYTKNAFKKTIRKGLSERGNK